MAGRGGWGLARNYLLKKAHQLPRLVEMLQAVPFCSRHRRCRRRFALREGRPWCRGRPVTAAGDDAERGSLTAGAARPWRPEQHADTGYTSLSVLNAESAVAVLPSASSSSGGRADAELSTIKAGGYYLLRPWRRGNRVPQCARTAQRGERRITDEGIEQENKAHQRRVNFIWSALVTAAQPCWGASAPVGSQTAPPRQGPTYP